MAKDLRIRKGNVNLPYRKYTPQAPTEIADTHYISDYDDPLAINSLADLILATANPSMKRVDLGGVEKIPLLNIVTGLFTDIVWDKNLRPIVEAGDFGAAGQNLLTNVFETLDTVVNPVRAVVQSQFAGEDMGQAVVDSLGWSERGRKNFDYDIHTGAGDAADFAANLAAEVLSDPLNWISMGTAAVAKGTLKEVSSEALERGVREIVTDYSEELGQTLTKGVLTADNTRPAFRAAFRDWMEGVTNKSLLGKYATTQGAASFGTSYAERLAKGFFEPKAYAQLVAIAGDDAPGIIQTLLGTVSDYIDTNTADTILNGLRKVNIASENIQRGMFSAAFRTSPIGWGVLGTRALLTGSDAMHRVASSAEELLFKHADQVNPLQVDLYADEYAQFVRVNKDALKAVGITQDVAKDIVRTEFEQRALINQFNALEAIAAAAKGDKDAFVKLASETILKGTNIQNVPNYITALRASGSPYMQQHARMLEDMFQIPRKTVIAAMPEQIIRHGMPELTELDALKKVYPKLFIPARTGNAAADLAYESLLDGLSVAARLVIPADKEAGYAFVAAANALKDNIGTFDEQVQNVTKAVAALPEGLPIADYIKSALEDVSQYHLKEGEMPVLLKGYAQHIGYSLQLRRQERTEMLYNAVAPLVDKALLDARLRGAISQAYVSVTALVRGVSQYSALSDMIAQSAFADPVQRAVMDTMHTYADRTVHFAKANAYAERRFADDFIANVSRELNAYGQEGYDMLPVMRKKYADVLQGATQDTDVIRGLATEVLKKDFGNKLPIVLKMDLSSDLPGSAEPLRILYKIGDGPEVTINTITNTVPDASKLRQLLDMPVATNDEVYRAWQASRANLQVMFQQDAMQKFAQDVYNAGGSARRFVVLTYGGTDAELPVMRRMLNTSQNFEHKGILYGAIHADEDKLYTEAYDVLQELRHSKGVYALTPQDVLRIREILHYQLTTRTSEETLLYTINKHTVNEMLDAGEQLEIMANSVGVGEAERVRDLEEGAYLLRESASNITSVYEKVHILESGLLRDYGLIDKREIPALDGAYNITQVTMQHMPTLNARKTYDFYLMQDYMELTKELANGITPQQADEIFSLVNKFDKVARRVQAPQLITPKIEQALTEYIRDYRELAMEINPNYAYINPVSRTQKFAVVYEMQKLLNVPLKTTLEFTDDALIFRAAGGAILPVPSVAYWKAIDAVQNYQMRRQYSQQQQRVLSEYFDANDVQSLRSRTSFTIQNAILPKMTRVYELAERMTAPSEVRKMFDAYTDLAQLTKLRTLREYTDAELLEYVYSAAKGFTIIDFDAIAMPGATAQQYAQWADQLANRKVPGLLTQRVENALFIGLDPAARDTLKTLPKEKIFDKAFSVVQRITSYEDPRIKTEELFQAVEDLYEELDRFCDGAIRYSMGSPATEQSIRQIYNSMPDNFMKKIMSPDDLKEFGLFDTTGYDHSFIGDLATRKKYGLPAQNLMAGYLKAADNMMNYADRATRYRTLFFSPGSVFKTSNMYHGIPATEVQRILADNKQTYGVYALVKDLKSKTGARIAEMPIAQAYAEGSIVLPRTMAHNIMRVWNKFEFTNPAMRVFDRLILSPLKSGYLMSLGWVFRNYVSANFSNITSVNAPAEIGDIAKSTLAAGNALRKYTEWATEIMRRSPEGYMTAKATDEVLETLAQDDVTLFRRVHAFISSAASGGQLEAVYAAAKNTKDVQKDFIDELGGAIGTALWENPVTKLLIKNPNDFIEQTRRLGKYFHEIQYGATVDEALARVLHTHFNYDKVSYAQLITDTVLPFSGFLFNTLTFWADQLNKHGWVATLLGDVVNGLIQQEDYDEYEMNENRSLQYNILAGNMILEDQMTVKLSLPVMDAYQLLTNPFETLWGKVNAPARTSIEYIRDMINNKPWSPEKLAYTLKTNAPLVGTFFQRYYNMTPDSMDPEVTYVGSANKAMQRTNNPLTMIAPSIFGGVQRQHYFTYGNANTIYMTPNVEKYMRLVEDGATPVVSLEQIEALRASAPDTAARKKYYRAYSKKPSTARSSGHASAPHVSKVRKFSYKSSMHEYWKVKSNRRGTLLRSIERPAKMIGPRLYRNLYTDKGTSRFRNRMMPASDNAFLAMRMRQSWSLLR